MSRHHDPQLSQAETLAGAEPGQPVPTRSPGAAAPPAFPVQDWDRYEFLGFLGQGGMGMVFLARDRRLHREVAIKFVRSDDERFLQRFMVEARAQARVNHEHVCKVFEVGEVEGKVFIAMQPIAGASLDLTPGLTLEQKVVVLRDAALGVHEAHRVGIIHRDLKPANILLERAEDGAWRTYVMDFGLAREWNQDVTETGAVLGTPFYMSPEQARGEVSSLDRRTDIYSLGATLYHTISGRPPVAGANPLEVLSAIASAEIPSMRAQTPDLPRDLDAIALKCLEKERSRRYDSARALADDLDRFLAGEPVLARPTGLLYRLQRKVRKHKQLTAIGAVAGVLVLLALGAAIRTRREAGQRVRLAQQFTEAMARIESMARYSALSPLHDIRPDLQAVRDHMTRLQADMRQAGALANGPGHYALGRGYWMLDDAEQAREHLQMAWDAGYREPRAAFALAVALGRQYGEKLLEVERLPTLGHREARRKDLEATLRAEALAYLRQAQGTEEATPAYLEGLRAFYEGRLDEALDRLKVVGDDRLWFYESRLLRGSLLQARAWKRWNQGDREGALTDFALGRGELATAAANGRSAPAVHAALAELELNVLLMEKYGRGRVEPAFTRGMAAAQMALTAQPDHPPSLILQSALLGNLADFRTNRGEASEALVEQAVATALKAVEAGPRRLDAWSALGTAHYQRGNALLDRGLDPTESLQLGLRAFESISVEKRDYHIENHIGLIHQTWSDFALQQGQDPLIHLTGAIAAFTRATRMDPYLLPAWINLGTCLQQRAALPGVGNAEADLRAALRVLDQAQSINPRHFVPYFVRGKVHAHLAQLQRDRGEDPAAELQRSVADNRAGLAINDQIPHLHNGEGLALLQLARLAWDSGRDPLPLLRQAQAAYLHAIQVAPRQVFGYLNQGDLLLWKARWEPSPAAALTTLQAADAVLKKGLAVAPGHRRMLTNLGQVEAVRVAILSRLGGDPRPSLRRGEAILAGVLRQAPRDPEALLGLGELRWASAKGRTHQGQGAGADFAAARAAYQQVVEVRPGSPESLLALAGVCLDQAEWERSTGREPSTSLAEGQVWLNRAQQARPHWAEAIALQGSLYLEAALASPTGARAGKAKQAWQAFELAFSHNGNLAWAWKGKASRARQEAG